MYFGRVREDNAFGKTGSGKVIEEMANLTNSLASIMQLPGAIGTAIVDLESGMNLGQSGGGIINLDIAAAGNTEVMRAKMRTMADLGLNDEIEDVLITLGTQYHILRPLKGKGSAGLFVYVALDKGRANLAMSRHKSRKSAERLRCSLHIIELNILKASGAMRRGLLFIREPWVGKPTSR